MQSIAMLRVLQQKIDGISTSEMSSDGCGSRITLHCEYLTEEDLNLLTRFPSVSITPGSASDHFTVIMYLSESDDELKTWVLSYVDREECARDVVSRIDSGDMGIATFVAVDCDCQYWQAGESQYRICSGGNVYLRGLMDNDWILFGYNASVEFGIIY